MVKRSAACRVFQLACLTDVMIIMHIAVSPHLTELGQWLSIRQPSRH